MMLVKSVLLVISAALVGSITVTAKVVQENEVEGQRQRRLGVGSWFCSTTVGSYVPFFCDDDDEEEVEEEPCPDIAPLNETEFDLDRYIAQSWFVQKQQVNPYQSEDQLYCVVATYNNKEDSDFISVNNYGNNDEVNGEPQISNTGYFSNLCARQIEGGELEVAPCLFKPLFDYLAGPYWVIALDQENYSWAVVSGGAPDQKRQDEATGETQCTTKEGSSFLDTNGSGLWLFTREKVASLATVAAMEEILNDMGIYTGDLKPVVQEGCEYEGAVLKDM